MRTYLHGFRRQQDLMKGSYEGSLQEKPLHAFLLEAAKRSSSKGVHRDF